jgi:transcription factor IIIB 90 kDa subunit
VTCPNDACPNPDIIEDDGKQVCATCGVVARESNIVSELQFGETSSGAAAVQGSYVGEGRTHGQSSGGPQPGMGHDGLSSREITAMSAKREIDALIMNLGIPSNITDAAVSIFRLSLAHAIYDSDGNTQKDKKNFVQGRSIRTVAAVALYIACRRQKNTNTIMLIDIAEIMTPQVSVFRLGNIYNRLVRAIWGNADGSISSTGYVHPINPENLIRRFARDLEFGPLVVKVTEDAIRLVQRMDRDWMTTGRRPAGICGAALILAARMNNFRRTVREVVLVVKVCEVTVSNRLEEFQYTESSHLTVQQMRQGDHTAPCDPPAFYRAQGEGKQPKKRGRKRKNKAPETAAEIEGDDDEEAEEPPRKRGRVDKDGFAIPDIPIDPALRNAQSAESPSDEAIASALTYAVNSAASEMEQQQQQQATAEGTSTPQPSQQESDKPRRLGRPKGSKNKHAPPVTNAEMALEAEIEHDILDTMNSEAMQRATPSGTPASSARSTPAFEPPPTSSNDPSDRPSTSYREHGTTIDTSNQLPGPNLNAKNISQQAEVQQGQTAQSKVNKIRMDPEILDDEFDDDPEVANVILSEQEVLIKEHIWVEENKQWLRDEHAKRIKKQLQDAADIAAGLVPGQSHKKKRRRGRRLGDVSYLKEKENGSQSPDVDGEGDEAGRARRAASIAMKGMLEQRGYSRRLNYDALSKMFPDDMASVREGSMESRRITQRRRQATESREGSLAGSNGGAGSPTSRSPASNTTLGSPPSRPISSASAAARTAAQLPTPSAIQSQRPAQDPTSTTAPSEPRQEQTTQVSEGEEELIGVIEEPVIEEPVIEESDSPLSSLQETVAYNSPQLGTGQNGGPEDTREVPEGEDHGDEEEDEEEEDPEDYEQDDEVEQAFQGQYRHPFGDDDEDDEDEEAE